MNGYSYSIPVQKIYNLNTSTTIAAASWLQLDSSLDEDVDAIEVYNESSEVLKLAIGAAGAEVEIPTYILPGGQSYLKIPLAKGTRLSVRAKVADVTTGQLIINCFR